MNHLFEGGDPEGHVKCAAMAAQTAAGWWSHELPVGSGSARVGGPETSGLRHFTHYREPGRPRYYFAFPSSWWPGKGIVEGPC